MGAGGRCDIFLDSGEPFSKDAGFQGSIHLKDDDIMKKERKRKLRNLLTNITM